MSYLWDNNANKLNQATISKYCIFGSYTQVLIYIYFFFLCWLGLFLFALADIGFDLNWLMINYLSICYCRNMWQTIYHVYCRRYFCVDQLSEELFVVLGYPVDHYLFQTFSFYCRLVVGSTLGHLNKTEILLKVALNTIIL